MKKQIENEEFISSEVSNVSEYQSFNTDNFESVELFNEPFEVFEEDEIQSQSFVQSESNDNSPKDKKNLNDNQLRDKLSKINSSSTAANTTGNIITSIGSTGVLVVGGLLGGTLILGLADTNQNIALESMVFDYYEINPHVELIYNEELGTNEEVKVNEIKLFFDDNIETKYKCRIVNTNTNDFMDYDSSLGYVVFSTQEDGLINYDVQLLDQNDDIVDYYTLDVNTVGPIEYQSTLPTDYMQTFNDDGSTNIYLNHILNFDTSLYTIENKLELFSEDVDNPIKEVIDNQALIYIENIDVPYEMFSSKLYLIDNQAHYLIHSINKTYLQNEIEFNFDLDKNVLTFYIDENMNVADDVIIDVTYSSDNATQQFVLDKDKFDNTFYSEELLLQGIDNEISINLNANVILNNHNDNNTISNYKGDIAKEVNFTQDFTQNYSTTLELTRLEVAPHRANYTFSESIPTRLYFDGLLMKNDILSIEVYDSTNTLIDSKNDITSIDEAIVFYDLPTEDVRFDYKILNNSNEKLSNSYTTSLDNSLLSELQFSMRTPNPGDVGIGFNENDTVNLYFAIEYQSLTENYDTYCRIDVNDNLTMHDNPTASYAGVDNIAIMYNVDASAEVAISYFAFIVAEDGITAYGEEYTTPSGTILIDWGEENIHCETSQDDPDLDIYTIKIYAKLRDENFITKLYLDDATEGIDIPCSLIDSSSSFTISIDLSEYTFSTFYVELTGYFGIGDDYYWPDSVKQAMDDSNENYYKYMTISSKGE